MFRLFYHKAIFRLRSKTGFSVQLITLVWDYIFSNTFFVEMIRYKVGMKMEQTECFETSAYKIQTPGNNPEESIQQ
jgi:hypothetical protein